MEGFKLVRRLGVAKTSCVRPVDSPGHIRYYKNRWVKPRSNCGPLAVFKHAENALSFAKEYRGADVNIPIDWELWRCEYLPSAEKKLWLKGGNLEMTARPQAYWPDTDFADRVKLIERVEL